MAANTPCQSALPTGLRVLVVEDEMLVAMPLDDVLQELGCKVVGPAGPVAKAVPLANMEPLDAAILDVDLLSAPASAIR